MSMSKLSQLTNCSFLFINLLGFIKWKNKNKQTNKHLFICHSIGIGNYWIRIFSFFLEWKMGAFMAILHSRAGPQMASDGVGRSRRPACTTVWGVTPLKMPTNGLLRTARFEPKCGARSERTLPTQPSPPLTN